MAKGTLNKVQLIGRVGADPEVRYMPNGTAVANIRLATNDGYKDKNSGDYVESTEWHRVVCFSKLASPIASNTMHLACPFLPLTIISMHVRVANTFNSPCIYLA